MTGHGVRLRDGGAPVPGTQTLRVPDGPCRRPRPLLRSAHPRQLHQRARRRMLREAGVPGGRHPGVHRMRERVPAYRSGRGRYDGFQTGHGGQPQDLREGPRLRSGPRRHHEGRRRSHEPGRHQVRRGEHEGGLLRGPSGRDLSDIRHGRGQTGRGRGVRRRDVRHGSRCRAIRRRRSCSP